MLLKKITLLLIFCFLVNSVTGQIVLHGEDRSVPALERIINQERATDVDAANLQRYLAPLKKTKKTEDAIIYNILYANGLQEIEDQRSEVADQLYLAAIKTANESNNSSLLSWSKINFIQYLYKYRDYKSLTPILTEAIYLLESLPADKVINPGASFHLIGNILQTFREYKESSYFLLKSNKNLRETDRNFASNLDNIGLNYLNIGDFQSAEKFFKNAISYSLKIKDYERFAKANGNLGDLYLRKKDYQKAIEHISTDIEFTKKYGQEMNLMYAATLMAKTLIESGNFEDAQPWIAEAEKIARSKPYYKSSEYEILTLKLKVAQHSNNREEELLIYNELKRLQDSLQVLDSEENTARANWEIQKANFQRQLADNEKELSVASFRKNASMATAIAIAILGLGIIFFYRRKISKMEAAYDQRVNFYEVEKQKYENELAHSSKNIANQIDYFKNKNLQIQQINSEIEMISNTRTGKIEQHQGKLHALLQSHLMTDENWTNFKNEFYNSYPTIRHHLTQNFPEATESHLRIVFLQKLGFTNSEISGLLGITVDAVKKSNQRLRYKLGPRYEDFKAMINESEVA